MKIRLKEWKTIECKFKLSLEDFEDDQNLFNLESASQFPEEEENEFAIRLRLTIDNDTCSLYIETIYFFEVDQKITDDFKASHFPKVNAPAIAFPYLRAFVSNITLQAGVDPIMLPSINFVEKAIIDDQKSSGTKEDK